MGVSDKFRKNDVSFGSGKSIGYPKQMRTTYSVTTWQNYGINQTPRETLIHRSGSASRENSVQVFATRTNSGSERNKFLSNQNKINQQSLAELKWWKENFFLQNGKSLRIGIPQSLIQTDTSKTGWAGGGGGVGGGGQSVRKPPRGELGHIRKGQNISIYWSSLQ